MADESIPAMLDLALRLAGDTQRIVAGQPADVTWQRKPDDSIVTATDYAIQAHYLDAIARAYPDHAVWAEESVQRPKAHASRREARFCWVVDPLDGTRNYAAGFPCFATAVAVLDRGDPVVGVIRDLNLGHTYQATRGGGAALNGRPLRVAPVPAQADALVGVPSSKDALTVAVVRHWAATSGLILRNLGSTTLHLGLVAASAMGAAFCKRCKAWDVAAGALLVIEAGGRVTDPDGGPLLPLPLDAAFDQDRPFLAAEPATHARLLNSIRSLVA